MIALIGISYKSASQEEREPYVLKDHDIPALAGRISSKVDSDGIVVLSTCNRTEIYLNISSEDENGIYETVSAELKSYCNACNPKNGIFYFYTGKDAVHHLFKVASGIDSLVLGEDQIIGQVREAFHLAQKNRLTGCITTRLFTKAIEAGKRVRSETAIRKGVSSIGHASADLCNNIFQDLSSVTIMAVGAGKTIELFLQRITKRSTPALIVANRTLQNAENLCATFSGKAIGLTSVEEFLPLCDLVVAATSSGNHIITRDMAKRAIKKRQGRKQVFVDISAPSNIDREVKNIEGAEYFGFDKLKKVQYINSKRSKDSVSDALEILSEVEKEFYEWLDIQNLTPTIHLIKKEVKRIQKEELENFVKNRKIEKDELIEQYSKQVSEKFEKTFIKKLKELTSNGKNRDHIEAINNFLRQNG